MCARALKRDKCYTNRSTENCKVSGFVHTMSDNFLCRHENLSGVRSMNTYPICVSPLQRSARGSFAPLQREIASKSPFLCVNRNKLYLVWFSCQRKSYPLQCEHSFNFSSSNDGNNENEDTNEEQEQHHGDAQVRNDEKEAKALLTRLAAQVVLHSRCWTSIAGVQATSLSQHLGLNKFKALHKQVLVFQMFYNCHPSGCMLVHSLNNRPPAANLLYHITNNTPAFVIYTINLSMVLFSSY